MTFLAFLAVGTAWFYVSVVVAFLMLAVLVEWERGLASFFWLAVSVVVLAEANKFRPDWSWYTVLVFLGYVVAYFVIGTGWAFIKEFFYASNRAYRYKELVKKYPLKNGHQFTTELNRLNIKLDGRDGLVSLKPVSERKATIMMWISYWPASAVGTLLNDPVRRIANGIYYLIGNKLQAVSNYAARKASADFVGQ
jgi:hypothetical protein